MGMHNKGLTKLVEECGELIQIAAKKMAYMNTDKHPDGNGSLKHRLEDEMADVMAICEFVSLKLNLDENYVLERARKKRELYKKWDEIDKE